MTDSTSQVTAEIVRAQTVLPTPWKPLTGIALP